MHLYSIIGAQRRILTELHHGNAKVGLLELCSRLLQLKHGMRACLLLNNKRATNPQLIMMDVVSFTTTMVCSVNDMQAPLSAPALAHEAATAAAAAITAAAAAGAAGMASSADAGTVGTSTRQARTSARPHWDAAAL